jgi:hypothetical protein
LVRGLWLQGHADRALDLVEQMIAESTAVEHTLTLAHILSDAACFIGVAERREAGQIGLLDLRDGQTRHCGSTQWRSRPQRQK